MAKCQVLLVDDQREVLWGLRSFLEEALPGVDILEARNGLEGYDLAVRNQPDVLVADIMMPGMDGLNMLRRLKPHNLNTRTVILTAHERFEYARQAIELGVHDFLVKPVTQRQICQAVLKQLITETDGRSLYCDLMLHEYLSGEDIYLQRDTVMQISGLSLMNQPLWLVGIYRLTEVDAPSDIAQSIAALDTLIQCGGFSGAAYQTSGRSLFVLINFDEPRQLAAHQLLGQMHAKLVHCRSGISQPGRGRESLCGLYRQAQEALSVALEDEIPHAIFSDARMDGLRQRREQIRELAAMLLQGQSGEVWRLLDELLAGFTLSSLPVSEARDAIDSLISETEAALSCALPSAHDARLALREQASLMGIKRVAHQFTTDALQAALRQTDEQCPPQIRDTIEYIRAHFHEPISVGYLANRADLSYSYLSSLFAKTTGHTVTEYIQRERLAAAAQMLREGPAARIADVAQRCGFDNLRYFSTCFRKLYGMTPQQYARTMPTTNA